MRLVEEFDHEVTTVAHVWIPLADGTRLSAKLWLPDGGRTPAPAVLEYIPYRKDDATAYADEVRHRYFAGHGYAAVRVDLRGSGDSEGVLADEYLALEQNDGVEVCAWIAEQPWCDGSVGMIGYSWGGFSALQVAARRPPALKAIITIDSADDRYLDDCHYMGGCLLASDMLKWAATMTAYCARPPDPRIVGDGWREQWRQRLESGEPLIEPWLTHQRDGTYWRQGSVADDYASIGCPVLAVCGWADGYVNAVPRLLEGLETPRKGIIGPWAHGMPYDTGPGPTIGFLQECLRWWDRWLRDTDNGVDADPALRAWIQDTASAAGTYAERPGHWAAETHWPSPSIEMRPFPLGPESASRESTEPMTVPCNLAIGEAWGVWCPGGRDEEMPGDQRMDDERSLTFDSQALSAPLELLGRPRVRLRLTPAAEAALVAVRLCDVAEDGESLLVSWGLLNLTHRESHSDPAPLARGVPIDVAIDLRACGHRFAPGRRVRLALSASLWPHAWPGAVAADLELDAASSTLELPVRDAADDRRSAPEFGPAEGARPAAGYEAPSGTRTRSASVDGARRTESDETSTCLGLPGGGVYESSGSNAYSLDARDPLSARVSAERTIAMRRDGWAWRVELTSELTCDASTFSAVTKVRAGDDEGVVYESERRLSVPRDLV